MENAYARTIPAAASLIALLPMRGMAVVCAPHAQTDESLLQTLITLLEQGELVAVIVADNRFDADAIARHVGQAQLKVARGETPHQVRTLVRRLCSTRLAYSAVVLIGLLEPFYDEGVKWLVAQHLLGDTLRALSELAQTMRVLVLVSPSLNVTRSYLKHQVVQAAAVYVELPALEPAASGLQGRLF